MPTANPEDQHRRRQAIASLLTARAVRRQSELVSLLFEQGLEATQSSVSRDLRDLGVAKQGGRYVLPPSAPTAAAGALEAAAELVRGMEPAGPNLLVIRTAIGGAARVALMLDRLQWPEVVGTLSGDDTIFVATATASHQRRLQRRLQEGFSKGLT